MLSCADRYDFYITVYSGEIHGSVFAVLYSSRYPSFGFPLAREVIFCSAIFIGFYLGFLYFSSILQTIAEYRSVYMPLVLLPSVHLLGRYLLRPALSQFCFPKLPMYKMIVAYMIVYFIYILLSNSCQGTIARNGYGYPAIGSRWGISIQIWVSMPRSQLSPGYFCANMGVYTPQPTFTGVFLCKYGCLYPAANFRWGISAQI